jgi:SMI1-KNR4 cell-wall
LEGTGEGFLPMIDSISKFLKDKSATDEDYEYRMGGSVDDLTIRSTETRLGVTFPPSYKKFLADVGWIEIFNSYFFGLRKEKTNDSEGNVITMTEYARNTWSLPTELIPIHSIDDQVLWCLDYSPKENARVEKKIVAYDTGKRRVTGLVSPDFWSCISDFLEQGLE